MKYSIVLTVLACAFTPFIQAQDIAEVFLSLKEKKEVKIYSAPSHRKGIKLLKHDFVNENYVVFTIHGSNDSMYHVTANYAIGGKPFKGWVSKKTRIAINSKYESQVTLYDSPRKTKKHTQLKITKTELAVIDCKGSWLKVMAVEGKSKKIGWLPSEAQCSNPYTTCN